MVKAIFQGHANHPPVQLPPLQWVKQQSVKQYWLPGGHEEITAIIGELKKVGIIRATHSPFKSSVWPVKKPYSTWRIAVGYRELNKLIPPLYAAVPSVMDLMDRLTSELGTYHFGADLANAFFLH